MMCDWHRYKGTYNIKGDSYVVCEHCDVLIKQQYVDGDFILTDEEYELLD